jgi:pyrroline-5-carboxylate reductase
MATAMVEGMLAKQTAAAGDLICYSAADGTSDRLAAKTGIASAASLADLFAAADTVVVAFKPQNLAAADRRLAELTSGRLVLSIVAGKTLSRISQVFPRARNLVRCMPNTPGQIGAGITGWCASSPLTPSDREQVEAILGALGKAIEIPEGAMDAVTALSGSGPAYVFEFAGALRDAGVAAGLEAGLAETLALETLLGASRLLARRQIAPEALRNAVTSPNGTTFAALQRLASGNFRGLIREAVLAAKARSEEISRE